MSALRYANTALDESVVLLGSTGTSQEHLGSLYVGPWFWLGAKGRFDKRLMYEQSFTTPLLMQLHGIIEPESKISAMMPNLDFHPTFLKFASAGELSAQIQVFFLKPVLDGTMENEDVRDIIYYQYYDYTNFYRLKTHYGTGTKRYNLIPFYDDIDTWEFYDLEKGPKKLNHAMENPTHKDVIDRMLARLGRVQKTWIYCNY